MASTRSQGGICSLVEDETLELEIEAGHGPYYGGLVVLEHTLVVIDSRACNLQLYSRHDGKLLATSHRLEDRPMGVCLIDETEVAVLQGNSKIVILSFTSVDVIKLVRTFNVQTGFDFCHSVAKVNSTDRLIISGVKVYDDTLCWCVVSLKDGHVDSMHQTFKRAISSWSHLSVKDNMVYISCFAENSTAKGVYAYDIFNPHTQQFLYQHHELKSPWGLTVDRRNFIFVCDRDSNRIHQLTDSGHLVTIHTVSSRPYHLFCEDQQGVLYTTSFRSNEITRYRLEYLHQPGVPVEILNMDDRSIQLFEEALKDGKETIYNIRIMVVGHMGAGKTTLVKRLLGEEVNISKRHSTEGIDVYVNCCDVSLSTHEWTRREKDSEQDYKLQRLVNVLNENYQMRHRVVDNKHVTVSSQRERNDHSPDGLLADNDKNIEVLYQRSPQQNLSSAASHQKESSSAVVQKNLTQSKTNTIPVSELGANIATETPKMDLLREMLKLLKENPEKAKQNTRIFARLTIWDFAGQYAFYTTHQMFLTRRAIYLLVSDAAGQITDLVEDECYFDTKGKIKCKVHDLVENWLNSIHTCAPPDKEIVNSAYSPPSSHTVIPPPVILVGTHVDQIPQPKFHTLQERQEKWIAHIEQIQQEVKLQLKATKQKLLSSSKKGVTCADPKLLYQVLYNSTQDAFSSQSVLERNCQTVGLKLHGETPGNGNCFFEAVSSQLKRLNCPVQMSPEQLRQDAVAFLKANRVLQEYAGNINFADFMCDESFEEYCARMMKDGEWADHVVVVAMARTLQRDIMIVTSSPSSGNEDNIAWVVGQDNFQGEPILLGHIWEHHYESLEPIDSPDPETKDCRHAETKKASDENDTKMNQFGNYVSNLVMPGALAGNNPGPRNPVLFDWQTQMNQMSMFGSNRGDNVMPTFSSDNVFGQGNPSHPQAQTNQPRMLGNIVMPSFLSQNSLPQRGVEAQKRNCREYGERYLKDIRSYLSDKPAVVHLINEVFAIDNTVVDSKLEELKAKIVEVASQQPYWGEQIPTRWFLLEQQLMKFRDAGVKVISHSTVENLNKEGTVQIKESEELDLFLKYLHETGTIIYFNITVLRDNIILDPKWLIDALKLLINAHPNLPECPADNGAELKGPVDDGSQSTSPVDSAQKWSDFREKGILSLELVEDIWTKEKHPQLHANKDHILRIMEELNIIAKPRSFSEIGQKEENNFLIPCMLRQESPKEIILPELDPQMMCTPLLRCIFTGNILPSAIFHRLLAACVSRWPVAKKKETSENLIFCGCCVFSLDLSHRLTLHFTNHVVFARITKMAIDEVTTPDAKLCSRVRRFITLNLSKMTSYLGQNFDYELNLSPPFQMWFADEGQDPDAPITPNHMNYARLCVALVTVCGNALREILHIYFPVPYKDIYQAILANRYNLIKRKGRPLLNPDQSLLVFPEPLTDKVGTLDQFDLSVLYTLIRNVSTVHAPLTGWDLDPYDQPRDTSLGASVERIRSFRNNISGHTADGTIDQRVFEDYWNKFEAVLHDIEAIIGGHVYSQELEKQKRQVFSIYEAC